MTQIAIPDDLATHLETAAARRGCSRGDLVRMFLAEKLQQDEDAVYAEHLLTPELEARFRESLAQAERGETVSGEVAMRKLESLILALEPR